MKSNNKTFRALNSFFLKNIVLNSDWIDGTRIFVSTNYKKAENEDPTTECNLEYIVFMQTHVAYTSVTNYGTLCKLEIQIAPYTPPIVDRDLERKLEGMTSQFVPDTAWGYFWKRILWGNQYAQWIEIIWKFQKQKAWAFKMGELERPRSEYKGHGLNKDVMGKIWKHVSVYDNEHPVDMAEISKIFDSMMRLNQSRKPATNVETPPMGTKCICTNCGLHIL